MISEVALGAAAALLLLLPLAWKWGLGLRRVALFGVLLALAWGGALAPIDDHAPLAALPLSLWVAMLTVASAFVVLAYRFYRDPERAPPAGHDLVLSPADGEVIYVRRSADGKLPVASKHGRELPLEELTRTPLASGDATVVGISLSFLDVHVNRAPVGGRIVAQRHYKGLFKSLRRPESLLENERATTVIEHGGSQLAVVLIASRLVRRIVSFVREGEEVVRGQRIGAIRFGSQVDLVLPLDSVSSVEVAPGDRVVAGESVVARLGRPATDGARPGGSHAGERAAGAPVTAATAAQKPRLK